MATIDGAYARTLTAYLSDDNCLSAHSALFGDSCRHCHLMGHSATQWEVACAIIPLFAHFSDVQWRTRAVHCFDLLIWEAVAIIAFTTTTTFAPTECPVCTGHRYTSVSCQNGDSLPTRKYLQKKRVGEERLTLTSAAAASGNELFPLPLSLSLTLGLFFEAIPGHWPETVHLRGYPFDRIVGKYLPTTAPHWATRWYACYFLPLISCWHFYTKTAESIIHPAISLPLSLTICLKHSFAKSKQRLSLDYHWPSSITRKGCWWSCCCRASSSLQCNPLIYQE